MSPDTEMRSCGKCRKALLWDDSNATIMSFVRRVGWRFLVITCASCGALNPLPMLVCLDEAEMFGVRDDEIPDEPPETVVAMARSAGLLAMSLDGLSIGERDLLGVNLVLSSAPDSMAA